MAMEFTCLSNAKLDKEIALKTIILYRERLSKSLYVLGKKNIFKKFYII